MQSPSMLRVYREIVSAYFLDINPYKQQKYLSLDE